MNEHKSSTDIGKGKQWITVQEEHFDTASKQPDMRDVGTPHASSNLSFQAIALA